MSLFTWFAGPDKTPSIDDLIDAGTATVERLTTTIASVVVEAADGIPGAQDRYRTAKDDLAKVTADVELLAAAKVEHKQREAEKLRQARAASYAQKVAAIRTDLDASAKHAERLQTALADASSAYVALVASRSAAMAHALTLPGGAAVRQSELHGIVAAEVYRSTAKLNNLGTNIYGLPGPVAPDLRSQSNPSTIPPLADRLRSVDEWTITRLLEASP